MTTTEQAVWEGLTAAEVAERVAAGQVNVADNSSSRKLSDIIRANTLTLFNAMLGTAWVLVMITGRWQDGLFGFVLLFNTAIGVLTEYRAKRTLDNLAILDAPVARVHRDGKIQEIPVAEVVLDEVLELRTGDQIPVDAQVLQTRGLEANESLLTGESVPVRKAVGDEVMSGSSVVAGSATVRASRVGPHSYAQQITAAARSYSLATSELQGAIKRILRVVSMLIVPMALALGLSQVRALGGWSLIISNGEWREAVVQAVAGVVGMIPDGLVLLVSLNFALAAVILARQNVLVQELPAVEILARVDALCLDKTGTITDGEIECAAIVPLASDGARAGQSGALDAATWAGIAAFATDPGANTTAAALRSGLPSGQDAPTVGERVPFSSARKWSAASIVDDGDDGGSGFGVWVLGAPEFVLVGRTDAVAQAALAAAADLAGDGSRVVLLGRAAALPDPDAPLRDVVPAALAVLAEHVREDAPATLEYFRAQDVALRVISGDNPETVGAIATKVDLLGDGRPVLGVDARDLPEDPDALAARLADTHVLGRVTPEQKVGIVEALQHDGRTVAMTGDGVNDALAIKTADLGIAMGNGASATKAVSRLVLLSGRFAVLPGVLAQGRRVVANMERVANFFLVKTAYSAVLALLTIVAAFIVPIGYPFLPRQLTLVSALTIGIPGFLLSLPPSNRRYVPGFLRRVLSFSLPAGLVLALAALGVYLWAEAGEGEDMARTLATLATLGLGLVVVALHLGQWHWWKGAMLGVLLAAGLAAPYVPLAADFFLVAAPSARQWLIVSGAVAVGGTLLVVVRKLSERWATREATVSR